MNNTTTSETKNAISAPDFLKVNSFPGLSLPQVTNIVVVHMYLDYGIGRQSE